MSSLDDYEQQALRRRIRGTRVGRALLVASVPLVLLAVFAIDNLYWEPISLDDVAWNGLALIAWAATLFVTQPRLMPALRAEQGLPEPEPAPASRARLLLFPAALLFQWWVAAFSPGSVLGVLYLVLLAVGWGHLARDAAAATAALDARRR